MFLPVPPQPDCASGWLAAIRQVYAQSGHQAHNVLIDIADPTAGAELTNPIVAAVDGFLGARDKSVEAIANTIFPEWLYLRYGMPEFIKVFHERVLSKVRSNSRWSGYYFERMTNLPTIEGKPIDQLSRMIDRMRTNASLNKHEISLFDPERDVTGSVYGGQCLSFLSFHLEAGTPKTVLLTAQYRNHYYVEKLLGNLIGLGRLMKFVANETGAKVGSLTVLSTHAEIDHPYATQTEITSLIRECEQASARLVA